jgi:hypothetical protein
MFLGETTGSTKRLKTLAIADVYEMKCDAMCRMSGGGVSDTSTAFVFAIQGVVFSDSFQSTKRATKSLKKAAKMSRSNGVTPPRFGQLTGASVPSLTRPAPE